jgi:hypothetical protein
MQQFITSLGIFLKGAVDRTPSLRARDWNERIVAPSERCLLLPGCYTTSVRTPRGQIVNISPEAGWHHPWFCSVRWKNGRDGRNGNDGWTVHVRPGFVNGQDPAVPGHGDLIAGPQLALAGFRSIPADGDPVPKFFARLGVRTPDPGISINSANLIEVDVTQRDETGPPPRLLAACDVWVSVARATYVSTTTFVDGSGASGQYADFSVAFDTTQLDRLGTRPRLLVGPQMPKVKSPTLGERLNGQFLDDGEDRIRISTIYFLSPPYATDPTPNQLWQPYAANGCFWNLSHSARNQRPAKPSPPLRMFTGLAGGWGDIIGNQILSGINAFTQQAENAIVTTTNEGRFWSI